jgi:outer membrane biogenesis lipoprotein LolB
MKSIKYFLALLMLTVLIGCSTTTNTTTNTTKEEKTSPIENVIEGLKKIQLPKF